MVEENGDDSKRAYNEVVNSLQNYHIGCNEYIESKIKNFNTLPDFQKNYLSSMFITRVDKIKEAIKSNQKFIDAAIKMSAAMFDFTPGSSFENSKPKMNKHIDTVLRQVYREWSVEEAFCKIYSDKVRQNLSVLVPGSGLGRLVYELATTGCYCIHNEDDMNMLIISYGFMNNLYKKEKFTIYPWVNEWSNNYGAEKIIRQIILPDIEISSNVKMTALAGDFHAVFNEDYFSSIDCIVTCFFIDTSINIISLIEKIHLLLKPRGVWINLGPLVYHYADDPRYNSIEPTFEEIEFVIFHCLKFEAIYPTEFIDCEYFYNPNSMHRFSYHCPFFSVRK
ncbi:hypothetical protein HZS_1304 [Henneguya salminicola]|nr:hypothetical protein HZS_1304 [Henneguya salminicola]